MLDEKELDWPTYDSIIEPIPFSEWAAQIVPIMKSNKASVRSCGDFKVTIKLPHSQDQIPQFASLAGGHTFTKINLSEAY